MKISNGIVKIVIGAILALLIIFLSLNSGYKISVNITNEPVINKPVKIDIDVSYNIEKYSPEEINVEIYNRYNKEETLDYSLTPLDEGTYSLIITPNYEGDYIVNITAKTENDSFGDSSIFTIEN